MKQGDGKGGGETGDNKANEKEAGELGDNVLGRYGMCSEEPKDLDATITNENVSEFLMNQLKEKPLNVSCVGEDLKDEMNDLDVTKQSSKVGVNESECFEMGSDTSQKHSSVDLIALDGDVVISCKETDICCLSNGDTEKDANKTEGNATDTLNMTVIENADFRIVGTSGKLIGDGSDSGVEVNGCVSLGGSALLRAFSNSGGYTSSCGGLEDYLTASTATPSASCDSSLISCYSTHEETEDIVTSTTMMLPADGDGTSEGGSESSSTASKDIRSGKNGSSKRAVPAASRAGAKKRTPTTEAEKSSSNSMISKTRRTSLTATPVNSLRPKSASSQHQTSATTKTPSPNVGASVAVRSSVTNPSSHKREKMPATVTASCGTTKSGNHKSLMSGSSAKSSSMSKSACGSIIGVMKGQTKDSSLSSVSEDKRDVSVSTSGKGKGTRNSSSMRNKVVGDTDDGRWPSSANKSHSSTPTKSRGGSVIDGQSRKLNVSVSSSVVSSSLMESKATALEKYATLPRRRRCKSPEVQTTLETSVRSHSVSRDPSLNRAASLRKQHHQREGSNLNKSLPPYPRRRYNGRTVIYHEVSSQTTLTISDVEKALTGVAVKELEPLEAIETHDQEVQVNQSVQEVEHLKFQLRLLSEDQTRLKADSARQAEELTSKEQLLEEERAEKLALKEELDMNCHRVLDMLRNARRDHILIDENDGMDCLQALEIYLQSSSNVIVKQQHEINDLQTLCQTLKKDIEKSLAAQKTLLQQQQETETESIDLQEFLQAEISTLADEIKNSESETRKQRQLLSQKDCELEQQQEECKHLVRISEQRRQENLALQAQLCSLEQRSRELLLQQGAAVSGAAVALSGLSSRLDGLIEQLVISYNISEKDLEEVIFHNEAYSKSNSSVEASPERTSVNQPSEHPSFDAHHTPSPKRGASFMSAVISAIRSAATGGVGKRAVLQNEENTEEVQEPHKGISSVEVNEEGLNRIVEQDSEDTCLNTCHSTGNVTNTALVNSESLQNLSQAILNRQQFELVQADGSCCSDDLMAVEYEPSGTDLLPPLEDCSPVITLVDQIIDVDNLVTKLLKVLRIIQLENDTRLDELHDERMQMAEQVRQEQENRREVQEEMRNLERTGARLRGEVQDLHLQLQRRVQELENTRDELQQHQNQIEIPVLKEKLAEREQQLNELGQKYSLNKQILTENWQQAVTEVRRQYEAIDRALETLHSMQGVVRQCPSLVKLQQDLEETNFQCASSLPVIAADLNANAPPLVTLNGTHSGGSNGLETTHNSGNAINGRA